MADISGCCNAFTIFNNDIIICSNCGRIIKKIENDEELITSIIYNVNDNMNLNISGDLLQEEKMKLPRCAHDITLELTDIKCPKCKSNSRLARDKNEIKIFICSKCRHVFKQ